MISAETRLALKVGLATALGVLVAFWFHFQDAYWVGISAFLICAERVGNSFDKMVQRILCTIAGAGSALFVAHYFMESPVMLILVSFLFMTFVVYKGFKNDDWYIWIFTAITFFMVVATVFTGADKLGILNVAFYRSLDIMLGSVIGFLVSIVVFPVHAGEILEAKMPLFLNNFERYYSATFESLFSKKKKSAVLAALRQEMSAEVAIIASMRRAAEKESVFFERERRVLLGQGERISIAIKEFTALEQHFHTADLSYLQNYQTELWALHDCFKLFLHEPLKHNADIEKILLQLHLRYDDLRRQGLNFGYSLDAVTVFHEWVGLHQLLFDLIKAPLKKELKCYRIKIKNWVQYGLQNRFYWLFGMKVGFAMLLCPLLWVGFALPGAMQIAVSMGAVLNLDFHATKQKSVMRIYGCFLGAVLAMVSLLILRVESLTILLILIFAVAYYCSYLHNSASRFSYLGTQAIVAFLMGVIVNFSPSPIPDPAVERLVDIIGGVLMLYFILEILWPFSKKELINHYQGQLDEHFMNLTDMTQDFLKKPDFDLLGSMEKPLRIIKRDAAQATKQGLPLPYYVGVLDQLEAFLVFIAMQHRKLKDYESWVKEIMETVKIGSAACSAQLMEKFDQLLLSLRAQTLKGDFVPLENIMIIGTLVRLGRALV